MEFGYQEQSFILVSHIMGGSIYYQNICESKMKQESQQNPGLETTGFWSQTET